MLASVQPAKPLRGLALGTWLAHCSCCSSALLQSGLESRRNVNEGEKNKQCVHFDAVKAVVLFEIM